MEHCYVVFHRSEKSPHTLLEIIKGRMKGGAAYETLANSLQIIRCHGQQGLHNLVSAGAFYCFGYKVMKKLFPHDVDNRIACVFIPAKDQCLYHWTPVENMESIQKNGLVPKPDAVFVYLTDKPAYLAHNGFFQWKTVQSNQDMTFTLLRIRASELSREYEIHRLFAAHEFAVKMVPPQFIENCEPRRTGNVRIDGKRPFLS